MNGTGLGESARCNLLLFHAFIALYGKACKTKPDTLQVKTTATKTTASLHSIAMQSRCSLVFLPPRGRPQTVGLTAVDGAFTRSGGGNNNTEQGYETQAERGAEGRRRRRRWRTEAAARSRTHRDGRRLPAADSLKPDTYVSGARARARRIERGRDATPRRAVCRCPCRRCWFFGRCRLNGMLRLAGAHISLSLSPSLLLSIALRLFQPLPFITHTRINTHPKRQRGGAEDEKVCTDI